MLNIEHHHITPLYITVCSLVRHKPRSESDQAQFVLLDHATIIWSLQEVKVTLLLSRSLGTNTKLIFSGSPNCFCFDKTLLSASIFEEILRSDFNERRGFC